MGSPEDLVLSGAVDELFADDSLRFDVHSGTFRLPHPTGPPVYLEGNGTAAEWTAHAIERIGRPVVRVRDHATSVAEGGRDPRPLVTVHARPAPRWTARLASEGQSAEFSSLEELAEELRE
jgi:hypothetical protein